MSTNCKTVSLRTRKIKDGEQLSFYLDNYPGYRNECTMKTMRHESLGIYIYVKPKNQRKRDYKGTSTPSCKASTPSERQMWTCATNSWNIFTMLHKDCTRPSSCTPTQLQATGLPSVP